MQSGLYTNFTWCRNHVIASSANRVYLLVEWRGTVTRPRKQKSIFYRVANQVQLHLQLEAGVQIIGLYGCKAERLNGRNLTLNLGSLSEDVTKQIVLKFEIGRRSSGIHPIVSAMWTYIDDVHRSVVVPSRTISLQFSNHTGILRRDMDHRVYKYQKLLENPSILESALRAFEMGYYEEGEDIIRRRADEMLLYALRLGDFEYLREAEIMYDLSCAFLESYASASTVS